MLTSSMLSITASSIHSEESYMAVINQFHTEHSNANSQWTIIKNASKYSVTPIQAWQLLSGYIYPLLQEASFFATTCNY